MTQLSDIIGQEHAKAVLRVWTDRALIDGKALPHVLFTGFPGMGKTLFTSAIAGELAEDSVIDMDLSQMNAKSIFRTLLRFPGGIINLDEALALDTLLPTPSGWTTVGEIRIGDWLFGTNGQPTQVLTLTKIEVGRPCFQINFTTEGSIVTDAEHKWTIRDRSPAGQSRTVTTQELYEMLQQKSRQKQSGILIDKPKPLILPEQILPVDPYLLGLWLGDGSQGQPHLNIRASDVVEICTHIDAANQPWKIIKFKDRKDVQRISITTKPERNEAGHIIRSEFSTGLLELGIFHAKAIPAVYLRGSVAQRVALIQGLMDTDGHVRPDGYCEFINTNQSIVKGMKELLHSMGYTVSTIQHQDNRKESYLDTYHLCFQGDPLIPPVRLQRLLKLLHTPKRKHFYISSITPVESVPVRCLEVDTPDHLFLVGTEMIPTHNCHTAGKAQQELLLEAMDKNRLTLSYGGQYKLGDITFIGATTRPERLDPAFAARFQIKIELTSYSPEELAAICQKVAVDLEGELTDEQAKVLGRASLGVPRTARDLVRAWWALRPDGTVQQALLMCGVEEDGLSAQHVRYLQVMRDLGGQLGERPLGNILRLHPIILAEVERGLIDKGFLMFTPNGRMLTASAYQRLERRAA